MAKLRKRYTAADIECAFNSQLGVPLEVQAAYAADRGLDITDNLDAANRSSCPNGFPDLVKELAIEQGADSDIRSHEDYLRWHADNTVRASASTVSLPGVLSDSANKKLMTAYEDYGRGGVLEMCAERAVKDYKPSGTYHVQIDGLLKSGAEKGAEIKSATLKEEEYKVSATAWSRQLVLTEEQLINDDLDALSAQSIGFANAAQKTLRTEVAATLTDAVAAMGADQFFSTADSATKKGAKANALTGTAFGQTGMSALEALMLAQEDQVGDPANIRPMGLLCVQDLLNDARVLVNSQEVRGMSTQTGVANPFYNLAMDTDPWLRSSRLANPLSATAHFLWSKRGDRGPIQIGYVNGKKTPELEKQGQFEQASLNWAARVVFRFGVNLLDRRMITYSAGA